MESEIWDYYEAQAPGKVQVLGPDVMNGSAAFLQSFKNTTGVTFPLLLKAGMEPGTNMLLNYGGRHNYIVIDQQGTIRFNAQQQGYPYGSALDVPRIRQIIDSLLLVQVGVEPRTGGRVRLTAGPVPFHDRLRLSFAHPGLEGTALRIEVFDPSGRRVAILRDGVALGPLTEVEWDGRDASGSTVSAGLYLVRARAGAFVATRRVTRLR